MKLEAVTSIQEPNESQFGILIGKALKDKLKRIGWAKGKSLEVLTHGGGIFIHLIGETQAKEFDAALKAQANIAEAKPAKGKGKGD
jgi:hypothetical protein